MAELAGNLALAEPEAQRPRGSIRSGAGWAAGGRLFSQVLQFVAGLALARLLLPADFGLLASVYLVTGLTVIFFDLGLSGALVYEASPSREDLNTAFWLNALGGLAFVTLLAALGPVIADFFGDPRLAWLAPAAGLPFLLGVGMVHSTLLTRELKIKQVVMAESIGAVVNSGSTVAAAILLHGPSALVIGPALGSVTAAVMVWRMHPWRPSGFIRHASVKRLWGFSSGALTFGVISYFGGNSDNILVGRVVGAAGLGYYNRAFNLMLMPIQQVVGVMGRVLFPAFASMGKDSDRVGATYLRALRLITAVTFPMLLGIAATAPGLVPLLWGARWTPTVVPLQLLCLAGVPQVLAGTTTWLFESQGRTRLMSVVALCATAVQVVAVSIGVHWGVRGVAVAVAVNSFLCLPVTCHIACQVIGLPTRRLLGETLVTACLAAVMGLAAWGAPTLLDLDRRGAPVVGLQVVVGVVVYAAGVALVRRDVLVELRRLLRR